MAALQGRTQHWGSAVLALPLLLASLSLSASVKTVIEEPPEPSSLDGGARLLMGQAGALDDVPRQLGLPLTGANWLLWGGGATLTRPLLRLQASAWTGGLSATDGTNTTGWDLQLAELCLEQGYPYGSLLFTGGAMLDHAELFGRLQGPAGNSAVRAPLWGGGISAGVRWPRRTPMGFFVRGSYLWLQGTGDWRGAQAALLGRSKFDLGGPNLQGEVELKF